MQSLQFASMFPERFDRCVAIASTGKTTPGTVALRSVQRSAIELDPEFVDGNYASKNKFPSKGLGLARKIGTINYRSRTEFDGRFDWDFDEDSNSFEVERYLDHQAAKFTYYDPNCYLLLSRAMDLHDINGLCSNKNAKPRVAPKGREVCLLPYDTDVLMPPSESLELSKTWSKAGVRVYLEVLRSKNGHDAFLIQSEAPVLNSRLSAFLRGGVETVTDLYNRTVRDVDMGL
jgi:homoserine O-acetyltransferase/O-succinyltransferase